MLDNFTFTFSYLLNIDMVTVKTMSNRSDNFDPLDHLISGDSGEDLVNQSVLYLFPYV